MIEDKLTPAQRIRLESIAQANMRLGPGAGSAMPERSISVLIAAAREIESYIREDRKDVTSLASTSPETIAPPGR